MAGTNETVELYNVTKEVAAKTTTKPQSNNKVNEVSTSTLVPPDYSYLNSIAKDPVARNEMLENETFIDELCDKVFEKLKTKLGTQNFCGPNCNINCNRNSNCDDGAKV